MDITKCGNDKCKYKEECLRYTAGLGVSEGSFLYDPVRDCENADYQMFVDNGRDIGND